MAARLLSNESRRSSGNRARSLRQWMRRFSNLSSADVSSVHRDEHSPEHGAIMGQGTLSGGASPWTTGKKLGTPSSSWTSNEELLQDRNHDGDKERGPGRGAIAGGDKAPGRWMWSSWW